MSSIDGITRTQRAALDGSETGGVGPAGGIEQPEILPPSARLELSGDIGALIAASLLKAGREARKAAERSREAAAQAELEAFDRKIEAMRDAARERLIGGICAGAMTAAEGGLGVAGGAQKSERIGRQLEGHGKLSGASGGMTKAVFDSIASGSDRDEEIAARASKQAEQQRETAEDAMDDASKLMAKALDAYKEYSSARDAASMATILRA